MRVVYVGSIKFSFDTVVGVVSRSCFELINETTTDREIISPKVLFKNQ